MNQTNTKIYAEMLKEFGFGNPIAVLDGDFCDVGMERGKVKADKWVKDLRKVSRMFDVEVDNCLLVDDDSVKSVKGHNFELVAEYDPLNENDSEIITLVERLKLFVES